MLKTSTDDIQLIIQALQEAQLKGWNKEHISRLIGLLRDSHAVHLEF